MSENTGTRHRGFYVEGTWVDLGTVVLALALVLGARGLWSLKLGPAGLGAGVVLWWGGVAIFFRWIAQHSLRANDYPSWLIRLLAVLGMAWLFLWALEQAGLQPRWAAWLANSIIFIMVIIVIGHLWLRRTPSEPAPDAGPPQQGADTS
jgi:hypothetical protein